MIDCIPELRNIFKAQGIELIPEESTDSSVKYPCVTYREIENSDSKIGDDFGYSNVAFSIQIWGYGMDDIISICRKTDIIMKKCHFKRYMAEMQSYDGLHRKFLGYRKIIKENY